MSLLQVNKTSKMAYNYPLKDAFSRDSELDTVIETTQKEGMRKNGGGNLHGNEIETKCFQVGYPKCMQLYYLILQELGIETLNEKFKIVHALY